MQRLQLPVRKAARKRYAINVDVKKGHEDPDDEAFAAISGIAHGVAQRVAFPLDVYDCLVGFHGLLIENNPVCRRKKMGIGREKRPKGISKEVLFRKAPEPLVSYRLNLGIDPLLQALSYRTHLEEISAYLFHVAPEADGGSRGRRFAYR